jgi:hypothetical protein
VRPVSIPIVRDLAMLNAGIRWLPQAAL